MSLTGKSAISLAKEDLINQKNPAVGFKKVVFAHQAQAGESGINLAALSVPSSYSSAGFVQADYEEIVRASLLFYRKNLTLISTSRGVLLDYDSYTVSSNTQITFSDSFGESLEDEIFIGIIDPVVKTGNLIADAEFILETGTLDADQTDIPIGKSFSTNLNPTKQMGAVMVIVGGITQFRNVGNATAAPTADGNYEEVDNGAGRSTLIRMNESSTSDRVYHVVSTATTVIRPDGSMMDELEKQNGVIDKLVETTAVLAGVPETDFQASPTQPQLKQFGDRLLQAEDDIDELQQRAMEVAYVKHTETSSTAGGTCTTGSFQTRKMNTLENPASYSWISLASNQITLGAGTYLIEGFGAFYQTDACKLKIRNITDSTDELLGHSNYFWSAAGDNQSAHGHIDGQITLAAQKVLELQYRVNNNSGGSNGLGYPAGYGTEVYAVLKITKVG